MGAVQSSNSTAKKSSVDVSPHAYVDISMALEIIMEQDEDGEYFFRTIAFTVYGDGGGGAEAQIPTPIYINVLIGFEVSGAIEGAIVISRNSLGPKSYFDGEGSADLGDMTLLTVNPNDVEDYDAAFTFYGALGVAPTITLSAGVGVSEFLAVRVRGTAAFDLDFDTLGRSNGDVTLSAAISLQVLFFSKEWEVANETYNMFTTGSNSADLSLLYEGVETMQSVDLSYMDNRTGWNGLRSVKALDFASGDNSVKSYSYNESTLISGNNPYPNGVLKQLNDGRFIMVFIDDDTSRDEYNYAAVKYSINNGGVWSSPAIIDNDGTIDEAPDLFVLDDGNVLAVWSSACEPLTADDTAITALNKMDIKSAVFDTSTDTFSEPAYITMTTDADITSDSAPEP